MYRKTHNNHFRWNDSRTNQRNYKAKEFPKFKDRTRVDGRTLRDMIHGTKKQSKKHRQANAVNRQYADSHFNHANHHQSSGDFNGRSTPATDFSINNTNSFLKIETVESIPPSLMSIPMDESSLFASQQEPVHNYNQIDQPSHEYNAHNVDRPARRSVIKIERSSSSASPTTEIIIRSPVIPTVEINETNESSESSDISDSSDSSDSSECEIQEVRKKRKVLSSKAVKAAEKIIDDKLLEPTAKKKRLRRHKDACNICDNLGHREMQCQMICKNCNEPYHNMKKCTKPLRTQMIITNFLEFCGKQYLDSDVDVTNKEK